MTANSQHRIIARYVVLLCQLAWLLIPVNSWSAQGEAELRRAIQASTEPRAQAKLYKQLGDQWVSQDKLAQAAEPYSKALALDGNGFPAMERVQMAIYLSWADRLAEAATELKKVVALEPRNLAAGTHLARVLSWAGALGEAIAEADRVLTLAPDHKDALLVKADALQWQGRYSEAIPLYQQVVARDNDFFARSGLARAQLALGNRVAALENQAALKAENPKQQKELAKLKDTITTETAPTLDGRYNYYRDSDKNRLDRYSLAATYWAGNQKLGFDYRHTEASDASRDNRAEDVTVKVYSRLTDLFSAGAGLGFTQLNHRHTSTFPTGHLRVDARVLNGTVGATVGRETLSDTAELIENRIRMTSAGINLKQNLTERVMVDGRYNYKSFSDGNHANDLQWTTQYAVDLKPRIVIGHRFRLLDFHKQSGSGFFDPNNYLSNRGFASVYFESPLYYAYLEGFLGHQTFRRNGVASDDFIHGGSGSIGIKPWANFSFEINAEGGNFAAGSTSGFNYFIVGPRAVYRF